LDKLSEAPRTWPQAHAGAAPGDLREPAQDAPEFARVLREHHQEKYRVSQYSAKTSSIRVRWWLRFQGPEGGGYRVLRRLSTALQVGRRGAKRISNAQLSRLMAS